MKNIKTKNPALVGFFAFSVKLILWIWALQLLARAIFIFHRGKGISEGMKLWVVSSWHGLNLDFSMISYIFILCMTVAFFSAVFKKKGIVVVLIPLLTAIAVVTIILAFADAEMNHVWGSRFNTQAMEYMQHPREAMASSSEAKWVIISIFTLFFSFVAFYFLRKIITSEKEVFAFRVIPMSGSVLLTCIALPVLRGGFQTIPINQSSAYYSNDVFENNAAVNSTWNALYYIVNPVPQIHPEEYKFGLDKFSTEAYFHVGEKRYELVETKLPNVVLFILESYTSYVSKYFRDTYNATPFFDSISKSGLAFTNAYATGDRTDKGLAAVLSGWPGQPWQSILTDPEKAARLPSLPERAKEKAYSTAFIYGGDLLFANMSAYLRNMGFQNLYGEEAFSEDQKGSKWGTHDGFMMDKLLQLCSKARYPFFITALTLSSHEPYEIPGQQNKGDELTRFLRSVSYTDNCLRNFMERASAQTWFENTLFVFVADHGRNIGFPEMDFYQPRHFEIPIVFWGPALHSSCKGKIDPRICAQTDIAATLTEEVFGQDPGQFPWSRNLTRTHAEAAFYTFSDGFGYVTPGGHVSWGNHPPAVLESQGQSDSMLLIGKALQYNLIKLYQTY